MKTLFLNMTLLLMFMCIQLKVVAQNRVQTDTVTVMGNCGECKTRIEEAAYVKGVKHAEWNKETQVLTVVYTSGKVSLDQIEVAVAKVGHDTPHHKAPNAVYNKLPKCCAYRSGLNIHE